MCSEFSLRGQYESSDHVFGACDVSNYTPLCDEIFRRNGETVIEVLSNTFRSSGKRLGLVAVGSGLDVYTRSLVAAGWTCLCLCKPEQCVTLSRIVSYAWTKQPVSDVRVAWSVAAGLIRQCVHTWLWDRLWVQMQHWELDLLHFTLFQGNEQLCSLEQSL